MVLFEWMCVVCGFDFLNCSIIVDVGVWLFDINCVVGEVGFCVLIDFGSDLVVGGFVGVNVGGSCLIKYGDVCCYVFGIEVVFVDEVGIVIDVFVLLCKCNVGFDVV